METLVLVGMVPLGIIFGVMLYLIDGKQPKD